MRRVDGDEGNQAAIMLLGLLGFLVGYLGLRYRTDATAASRAFTNHPKYQVWALLVGAGTAYCGFVVLPLWHWRGELLREHPSRHSRRRALMVAAAWCVCVAVPLGFQAFTGPQLIRPPLDHYRWRVTGLLIVNLAVMLPAILSFQLLQAVARRPFGQREPEKDPDLLSEHTSLQSRLRGLLATVGGLVTVLVLELGALINAVNALPWNEPVPRELVYIFSSLLAAGVAVLYLPTFSAVQRHGGELVDHLCPLPSVNDPEFSSVADKRARLRAMLGLDSSAKGNLESGVFILTPLIGGVVTTFVAG